MIFWKMENIKRYTFKINEYNNKVVFLKRLEDGRVFFDNQIYEKDFFDYDQLENFLKIFYKFQMAYINFEFKQINNIYKKNKYKMSKNQRRFNYPFVKQFNPKRNEIGNLTYEQFKVLVNAFTFNFSYGGFDNTKIPKMLYKMGWKSIKPVYTIYKEPLFKYYSDFEKLRKSFGFTKAGSYLKDETWLEYDPIKKYNEFDIYSKTNTYARYNLYNNVYYKNYKGKKYSTASAFDFTEEEIKANYENMISDKSPRDKYKAVAENEKNRRYFEEFVETKIVRPIKLENGILRERKWFSIYSDEKVRKIHYKLLNDPRNILIMPIIDAYMELYRYDADLEEESPFLFHDHTKHEVWAIILRLVSIEYQEKCLKTDFRFFDDNTELYVEEDIDEKEMFIWALVIILSIGLVSFFLHIYYGLYISPIRMYAYNLFDAVDKIHDLKLRHLEHKPHLYYQLINRKGRCTIPTRILPERFYYDKVFRFHAPRALGYFYPSILERLANIDLRFEKFLEEMHVKLWNFGTKLGYR